MTFPLPTVSLDDAKSRTWDVIIVGSSFSAMFFLKGLPTNLSVLVVEKGAYQPHSSQISGGIRWREEFNQNNHTDHSKTWVAHTVFGGNSNCWWACTPRFLPEDFALKSKYGVGEDWPVSYQELAPYYDQVEEIMQIAGGGSDHLLPRSKPFPYPPHISSRTDRLLRKADPENWFAQPTARANEGDRPQCCANGICHLCPVDSKFTILNSLESFTRPNVSYLLESECRSTIIEAGKASGVVIQSAGSLHELRSNLVALAANAIFNSAILLRSDVKNAQIGVGITEQASRSIIVDGPELGYFGGTSITGHGYQFYGGEHRKDRAAVIIETFNSPPSIRTDPGKWTERAWFKLIAEDLRQSKNQIRLEDDEPHIEWHGYSDYTLRGLENAIKQLPSTMPFEPEDVIHGPFNSTEAHIIGAHVMGKSPENSVTDDHLRFHNIDNLFVLGSGAYPTTSPANPTLTLSALALRAAGAVS